VMQGPATPEASRRALSCRQSQPRLMALHWTRSRSHARWHLLRGSGWRHRPSELLCWDNAPAPAVALRLARAGGVLRPDRTSTSRPAGFPIGAASGYGRLVARTDSRASSASALARSLRQILADARRFDLSQSDPVVSARNAVGLVVPLALAA